MKETLDPIKKNFNEISDDEVSKILKEHSKKANEIAEKKIKEVYEKI
jgi:predicted phosphoribosyltransferase